MMKTIMKCKYEGDRCFKTYIPSRIGQKYCLACTYDAGMKLKHIEGKSKYLYKLNQLKED